MTQHFPLDYGDVVHQGFFDPIQELLGASLPSLRIRVQNSTTLQIAAGSGNDQVTAAIMGRYRFITSNVTATIGSITNGTGSVYIIASDNDFTGTPTGPPDVATNYGFAMEVRASGTPSTALYRKVGEVDVVGGAIKAFRPMGGPRPTGEFGLVATPDEATQPGILVKGLASQTGNLVEAQNSSSTIVYSVNASGASTQGGGITTTSTDGITASGAGGKDTLNLSSTGSNTGITIGGDTELYRSGANSLQTDNTGLTLRRSSSASTTLAAKVTSDGHDRVVITAGGSLRLGNGTTSPDVSFSRTGTTTVTLDDGSSPTPGAASLTVSGALTVGTTLTLSQATTAGQIPIADGTGLMNLGQAGSASIANDAVTADKLRDDASTDSNRAVTTNHIRDDAVTADKLAPQVIETKTSGFPYSIVSGDAWKAILVSSSSDVELRVTSGTGLAAGERIDIIRTGTGNVTIALSGSGATLEYTPGNKLRARYSAASLLCVGTNAYILLGDLAV